jgi:hypothetical protein
MADKLLRYTGADEKRTERRAPGAPRVALDASPRSKG